MNTVKRRHVLAGVGGGFLAGTAGCLNRATTSDCAGADGEEAALIDETGSESADEGLTATFTSVDDPPDPLCFEVTVLSDQLTETEFPLLEISVENVGTETAVWTQSGSEYVFPGRGAGEGVAVGTESEIETMLVEEGGCARIEWGIARDDVLVETRLSPGESKTQRYGIAGIDDRLDDECPAPGSYRAEHSYDDIGTWGFEFELDA